MDNKRNVLIVMANVYLVLNILNVPNVLGITETLKIVVTAYPISTKKIINVYLGNPVPINVLNVIATESAYYVKKIS